MAGLFNSISDAPEALKIEAETITIRASYGVPATGQVTINWNVPTPASGCAAGSTGGAYCGMVIVASTQPITKDNYPQDGTYYHDDPTVNADAHVGDSIGNALVVGSFWERETKSTGSENFTTSVVINDIVSGVPYYFAGFALDCTLRYHTEGIRAYSSDLGLPNADDASTPSFQNIGLGDDSQGIIPTDGTGLLPGKVYEFDMIYDPDFPTGANYTTKQFSIDGIDAGTYEDLLNVINNELLMLGDPSKLPYPPYTGYLYWDTANQKLYKFNGTTYDEITNIFVQDTDPSVVDEGQYWYNPETEILRIWSGTPGSWVVAPFMIGIADPTDMDCNQYWYDGSVAYIWNGNMWIELPTIVQSECPTNPHVPTCGTYWYDSANEIMYKWDSIRGVWAVTDAIYWNTRPDQPNANDYWMNTTTSRLSKWSAVDPGLWVDITDMDNVFIQETAPETPLPGYTWYKSSTETLYLWDNLLTEWVENAILVWPDDPTDTDSNDLWWNSSNDYLYQWDTENSNWVAVPEFIESDTDPLSEKTYPLDTMWYDTETSILYRWDSENWVQVEALFWATDPRDPTIGTVYYNKVADTWFVWTGDALSPAPSPPASPNALGWVEFTPLVSNTDPTSIPTGYYWMNTGTDILYVRNGLDWIATDYNTTPYYPDLHSEWLNTSDGKLYKWNGTEWVETSGLVTAFYTNFTSDGCKVGGGIRFETTAKGTGTIIMIPSNGNSNSAGPGCVTSGYADRDGTAVAGAGPYCSVYNSGYGASCGYPARVIHEEDFLWSHLTYPGVILAPQEGEDAPHSQPSYDVIGVGTDGTPDERRELIDSIRRQLGYPSITVELTHYQLDTAVQGALESYRKRTSASLKRGFYFLDIKARQQRYMMTNRRVGYDKIVSVMDTYRFSSAFLTQAHASGHYGQMVLQHLYNMGTYDLLSYDLVNQYINQLEISFATKLAFNFNEESRALDFYAAFTRNERILVDVMVERTEQSLLKDRYAKSWIERYALAEAMVMLSQIRGKFGTLPGAGGGVQLNADSLQALSDSYRQELLLQVDEFVVEKPEDVGLGSTFVFG